MAMQHEFLSSIMHAYVYDSNVYVSSVLNDSKKFSILKRGIGIEGEKIMETS